MTIIFSTERHELGGGDLVGGLADRLKGAAFAYLIAKRRVDTFEIHWPRPVPVNELFVLQDAHYVARADSDLDFDWVDQPYETITSDMRSIARITDKRKRIRIFANLFSKDLQLSCADIFAATEWSPDAFPLSIGSAIRAVFGYEPPASLLPQYEATCRKERPRDIRIGVQARFGGTGAWEDPVMMGNELMDVIPDRVIRRHGSVPPSVFLTADSLSAKLALALRFRDAGVRDVVYNTFPEFHFDRSQTAESIDVEQTVLDFIALSRCDEVYVGAGGFGSTAALYGGKKFHCYLDWQ